MIDTLTTRWLIFVSCILLLSTGFSLVKSQTSAVAIPFTDFLKAYPEIEKYLVQNVASDDIQENMNKASEFLQFELAKKQEAEGKSLSLVEALQRFVSLADEQDEQACNFSRYITLYYNYLASRSSPGEASLRVARIVDEFALKHAHLCTDFYGAQVRARYDQIVAEGELMTATIEGLLDSALKSATGPNMVEDLVGHFQQQNAPILGSSHGEVIYSILVKQSANEHDPDAGLLLSSSCEEDQAGELVIDKDNYEALERLFDRHIKQPCKSLVSKLRDVMEPAAFDVLYQPKRQDDFFYIIWARYKLCDSIDGRVRQKLLTSLVHSACDVAE